MQNQDVWVVLQPRQGQLPRNAREAISAGQRLAAAVAGRASAVVLGGDVAAAAADLAGLDLAAVYTVEGSDFAVYTPGAYIGALRPAIAAAQPAYVVFPHSYQSVDYVPRLAQELAAALVPEVTDFESSAEGMVWRRPVMGGKLQAKVRVKGAGTVLLSVQSGAFPADKVVAGSSSVSLLPAAGAAAVDREILGVEQVSGDQIDLSKAEIIVAVGRGVGGPEKLEPLEKLAAHLGADLGASRPVIDNGWLPRDRQIGSSGQTVAPKLYLAVGISGAIQHLVGMKASGCVVAINKDASAPIFTVSHYGLVGDLHEIIPALNEALAAAG